MAGFLYFLSGTRRPMTAEAVRELGLGHILDGDGATSYREAQGNTPSGAPGVTFAAASRHDRDVALAPGKQTWRRMPKTIGGGNVWLGYWDDAKPTPSDLAMRIACAGPAPPKATIAKSRGSCRFSMMWARAAPAMFSQTTAKTPQAAAMLPPLRRAAIGSKAASALSRSS